MIDVPKCSNLLQSTSMTHYKLKEFHYIVNMSKFSGSFHKTDEVLFCHKKKSMKLRTYLFLYILPHQAQHEQQDLEAFY